MSPWHLSLWQKAWHPPCTDLKSRQIRQPEIQSSTRHVLWNDAKTMQGRSQLQTSASSSHKKNLAIQDNKWKWKCKPHHQHKRLLHSWWKDLLHIKFFNPVVPSYKGLCLEAAYKTQEDKRWIFEERVKQVEVDPIFPMSSQSWETEVLQAIRSTIG